MILQTVILAVMMKFGAISATPMVDWPLVRRDSQASATVVSNGINIHLTAPPKIRWEYTLPKGRFDVSPVVADGTVFISGSDDRFRAVSLGDGKEKWVFIDKEGFAASPSYIAGDGYSLVCVGNQNGTFLALDPKTGDIVWKFDTDSTIDNAANQYKDQILFGAQDGFLYCLDAKTGKLVWKWSSEDQIRCFPTIAGNLAFVAGCDGKLHVVDVETGTETASVDLGAPTGSTPAVCGNVVYVGTEGNEMIAVDWKEVKVLWRFPTKQQIRGPAVVTNETVYFGGFDRTLYAVDTATGTERFAIKTKGPMEGGPIVLDNHLIFGANDSLVYVANPQTGDFRFHPIEMTGRITASPIFAVGSDPPHGRLLIATNDGVLTCFEISCDTSKK